MSPLQRTDVRTGWWHPKNRMSVKFRNARRPPAPTALKSRDLRHVPVTALRSRYQFCHAFEKGGGRLWPIPSVTNTPSARQLSGDKLSIKFSGESNLAVFVDLTRGLHLFGEAFGWRDQHDRRDRGRRCD